MAPVSTRLALLCISALLLAGIAAANTVCDGSSHACYKHKCHRAAKQCTRSPLELVECPDASAVASLPSYVTKLTECYETADKRFSCYGTGEHGAAGGGSSSSSSSSSTGGAGGSSRSSSFTMVDGHANGYMTECKGGDGSSSSSYSSSSSSSSGSGSSSSSFSVGGLAEDILEAANIQW